MKIAYLLLVHEYPNNVKNLILQLLQDSEAYIYVHVDKTADFQQYKVTDLRVKYLRQRYRITWGGWNMVQATLDLISEAKQRSPQYYCLLSGRDVVVRSPQQWNHRLTETYPQSFLDGDSVVDRWTEKGLDRVQYHFFYCFKNKKLAYRQNRIVRWWGHHLKLTRKMPDGLIPYCGSQWWTISDKHMSFILEYIQRHPEYVRFYKTVGIPDEQFFHTILLNDSLKEEQINSSQTYVQMIRGVVRTFTVADMPELLKSGYFFARKVQTDDLTLPHCLEENETEK